ncbi:hypothetical protein FN846DRAFT_347049 [Sphaerosporella brunnea]|uniref:Rhodopsin domain-containing protein n=1 Tax=Sphaerosporella brunnea TaxID=1250544 RepID=A0A5J5EJB7_9PEZI|nr:hypothetical protein FN846DRAFT_347049 [Sphaerosporella brunnea]
MKTEVTLGLKFAGIAITGSLVAARIFIAALYGYRTRSHRLEILGVACYTFSCFIAIYAYGTWCYQGILSARWEAQGVSEEIIKRRLTEPLLLKLEFSQSFAKIAAVTLAKAAFLIAYAPVYSKSCWRLQVVFMASVILTVLSFLASIAVYFFWCIPVYQNWQPISSAKTCHATLDFTALMIANIIHILSSLPLVALPIFALLSLRIKDRRDHCGVAVIVLFALASFAAALWQFLDAKLSGYTADHAAALPLGRRNAYVVADVMVVLAIQLAYSLPCMRLLVRSTFSGIEGTEQRGAAKAVAPMARDSWVHSRGGWGEEDSASKPRGVIPGGRG